MRVRAFALAGSISALTIVSGCGSDTEARFTDVRGDADTGGATSSSGGATSSGGISSGMGKGGKGAAGSGGAGGTTATSGGSPGTGGTSGGAGGNSGGGTRDGGGASVDGGGAGGTLPDASIGDGGTEPDGGDGTGGPTSTPDAGEADAGEADAGSFCDRLGRCCNTVQPVLRPSCRQYANAGTAVQCSVLIGLYCGAPIDAGPAADAGSGCDALSACCSRLGAQRQSCEQLASTGVAAACDVFRAALCPP